LNLNEKKKILEVIKNYLTPETEEITNMAISISELLNEAISGLIKLPDIPTTHIGAGEHQISIVDMLRCLDRTLTQIPQKLPSVSVPVKKKSQK